jgi:putative transcriptional regulator
MMAGPPDALGRVHVQSAGLQGQGGGVGELVERHAQLLGLQGEPVRDLLLVRELCGLSLQRRVEQEDAEGACGQQPGEQERPGQVTASWRQDGLRHTITLPLQQWADAVTRRTRGQDGAMADDDGMRGKLLVASPNLRGATFQRTVIAILEHNGDGALGVVVNRPGDIPLSDVAPSVAEMASQPAVLFSGGPVEPQAAIALGMLPTGSTAAAMPAEGWRPVVPPLVTIDLDHDPTVLASAMRGLRVFAGYAGWGAGQLESEIEQGAWYVVDSLPLDPFFPAPDQLWTAVLRRQPWPLSAIAHFPLDPTDN